MTHIAATPDDEKPSVKYDFWGGRHVSISDLVNSQSARKNIEQMRTFMDKNMRKDTKTRPKRTIVNVKIITPER